MSRCIYRAGRARPIRQKGVTLIELMVSMAIGLFVVGAVLVMYVGSGSTSTLQTQVSQMTEDAQIGFAQLSRDVQMAGYAEPQGKRVTSGVAVFDKPAIPRPVFGCSTGFSNPTAAVDVGGTAPTCGTDTVAAIQVTYQATTATAPVSGNVPVDCQGNTITFTVDGTFGNIWLTSNRYFVSGGNLQCASQSAAGALPIVQDVQAMQVWYGIAPLWAEGDKTTRQPSYYILASEAAAGDWAKVVSVRICLLMRTAEPVFSSEDVTNGLANYNDCGNLPQTPTDRRMYRAFFTTVALRNRMGF